MAGMQSRTGREVQFWKQSNHLVTERKLWSELRELGPKFTCAANCSGGIICIPPRIIPSRRARCIPPMAARFLIFIRGHIPFAARSKRNSANFRSRLFGVPQRAVKTPQGEGGRRHAFGYAESARWIEKNTRLPHRASVYLPHLDYNLQRLGPNHPDIARDLRDIDNIVGGLLDFSRKRGVQVLLFSEYGITPVDKPKPHQPRVARDGFAEHQAGIGFGTARLRREQGVRGGGPSNRAHLSQRRVGQVIEGADDGWNRRVGRRACSTVKAEQAEMGIDHPRAGDSDRHRPRRTAWFTYYYWLDDALAPDFARCVDIHRKPGYDPVELFWIRKFRRA